MEQTEEVRGNRRGMWNLSNPEKQLRFGFYLIGGGITIQVLVVLFLMVSLESAVVDILQGYSADPTVQEAILDRIQVVQVTASIISLILFFGSVGLGIRLSQRIYGPMVAIRRHIRSLIEGNYDSRVTLRDSDHFREIGKDLNKLAESLKR